MQERQGGVCWKPHKKKKKNPPKGNFLADPPDLRKKGEKKERKR